MKKLLPYIIPVLCGFASLVLFSSGCGRDSDLATRVTENRQYGYVIANIGDAAAPYFSGIRVVRYLECDEHGKVYGSASDYAKKNDSLIALCGHNFSPRAGDVMLIQHVSFPKLALSKNVSPLEQQNTVAIGMPVDTEPTPGLTWKK